MENWMRVEVPVTYSQSQLSYIAWLFSYTWYNINRKLSVGECSHMYHYTVFNHAKDKKFKQIHLGAWIAHRHTVQPKSNLQQMEYTHFSYWPFLPIQKLKGDKGKMFVEHRWWPDPPIPQPLSDDEWELKRLGRVQPWITMSVVAVAQVIKGYCAWSTDAFSYILPSHLKVNTSWVTSLLFVHIKKGSYLSLLQWKFTISTFT